MNEPKLPREKPSGDYVIETHGDLATLPSAEWNDLLARQDVPTPFMRHEYLSALHDSGCATPATGWMPVIFAMRQRRTAAETDGQPGRLAAAAVLYIKSHSHGEYVFDWAWADAYARHGLAYYPKATVAVPFTPVPGSRILAADAACRARLVRAMVDWARQRRLSSLHLLLGSAADLAAARDAGLLVRDGVQFHWRNRPDRPYTSFEDFLAELSHDKRKKIRQERRKVADAGVSFRHAVGSQITRADWDFFHRCYEHTYFAHGNAPYLSRGFFTRIAQSQPENWLLFIAERQGRPIASSLIGVQPASAGGGDTFGGNDGEGAPPQTAYGRYWGALEDISCLHFEACYYQPIAWCIHHGARRFEGGAQGEHKMARALMPTPTASAHWLAHPAFAQAVEHFLHHESLGMARYLDELRLRTPFRP